MKYFFILIVLFSCEIFTSCSTPIRLVKLKPKPKDVYTNSNLKIFLKNNPEANVVLRIPNASENVTTKTTSDQMISAVSQNATMDIYYNAIEKEFLKAGFSVRDRGLFNEVLKKMSRDNNGNINYSQIKDLTNTELIIEVIKINPSVEYVTNQTYTINKRGAEIYNTSNKEYKKYGASAEFKIILVKNNEMAGTYTFSYTPCTDGCPVSAFNQFKKPLIKFSTGNTITPYEGVEKNIMEDFIRRCAQDLITAMKN